jgi:hypothetical protein
VKPPLLLATFPKVHDAHYAHADTNPIPDGRHVAQRHNVVIGAEDVVLLQREGALRDLVKTLEPPEQCFASADLASQRVGAGDVPDHLNIYQSGEGFRVTRAERVRSLPVRDCVRVLHSGIILPQVRVGLKSRSMRFPAGAPGGSRTPNLLIRSQMLYPLSYRRGMSQLTRRGRAPCRVDRGLARQGTAPA